MAADAILRQAQDAALRQAQRVALGRAGGVFPFPEQQQDAGGADFFAGVQREMGALHARPHGIPSRWRWNAADQPPDQPMAPITPPFPSSRLKKGRLRWSISRWPRTARAGRRPGGR